MDPAGHNGQACPGSPLDDLCHHLEMGVVTADRDLRVTRWNHWLEEKTGLSEVRVLGRPLVELFPELKERKKERYLAQALAGEVQVLSHRLHRYLVRLPVRGPHGEDVDMFQTARIIPTRTGDEIDGVALVLEDVSERQFREDELLGLVRQLRESRESVARRERQFRGVFESASDSMVTLTAEGRIVMANPAAERLLGYPGEDLAGREMIRFVPEPDREAARHILTAASDPAQQDAELRELSLRCRDGSTHLLEATVGSMSIGEENGVLLFHGRDITERRLMEDALRRSEEKFWLAQKAEAVGMLAGGIAHDLNNMLSVILGYTELALQGIDQSSDVLADLEEVREASMRARELTDQLLAFTGRKPAQRRSVPITPVVSRALDLFRRSVAPDVRLIADIADAGSVLADTGQLEQLVINLCSSASGAVEPGRGVIEVRLEPYDLDDQSAAMNDVESGEYARLTVADNGKSMDHEAVQRVFDPYYDARTGGRGRGLGLAVSQGIVKSHGGFISVYSEPGEGSTIRAYLPVVEGTAVNRALEPSLPRGGSERILLVEDEPPVAMVESRMLSALGYSVTVASNGLEALDLLVTAPEAFDLVISDMTMPIMSGDIFVAEALKLRPDLPVILCTGYSERVSEGKVGDLGIKVFLSKPVRQNDLARAVRSALDD